MKRSVTIPMALSAVMLGYCAGAFAQTVSPDTPAQIANPGGDAGVSGAIDQKLMLTPVQRSAIYKAVSADKTKTAAKDFAPVIGADVPPMIELYALPDDAVGGDPAATLYKYTMVEDRVVVVDPTKMRVIDVIDPPK